MDAIADDLDLSKERCNVFIGPVCMALPRDASMFMDAPVDFQRYRLSNGDNIIMFAYVQHSAGEIEGTQSFAKDVRGFAIKGYISTRYGTQRMDVVFVPRSSKVSTVHVYADVTGERRDAVGEALAGLRPCTQKSLGDISCPSESTVGTDLVRWLRESSGTTFTARP
ncbi:hypothetical protein KPL74_04530 [Bacillus sp. NP157]|nr:hypothetical protein KPL74_04530 [Bacillus sp. NP157]